MLKSSSKPLLRKEVLKKSPNRSFPNLSPLTTPSPKSIPLSSSIKIISDPNSSKDELLKAADSISSRNLTKPKFLKACLDAHVEPIHLKNSDFNCELLRDLIPRRTIAQAWELVTENLPYIRKTIRVFNRSGDCEDFLPISLHAALYYDPDSGPFLPYLRQHLIHSVSDSDADLVRRPKKIRSALYKIQRALASDPHLTLQDLSDKTGICAKKLDRFFKSANWSYLSLDSVEIASDTNLLRTNDFRINPSNLSDLLDSLSTFQKTSILSFYFDGKSLSEIASVRGCTKQAVDQAIDRGLYRLYCIITGKSVRSIPSMFK